MKLVVCVKHVPAATGERRFAADGTVDREAADRLLSELDEYAVEEAVRLAEELTGQGHEAVVTAVTMGPEAAADALKRALQMGADEGVHVLDPALPGTDAAGTARVLAAAVRELGAELVLTGMASTDAGMGVMAGMLSHLLGVAQVSLAHTVALTPADDGGWTVRIDRDTDTVTEVIEARLPAVLGVTDQANEPRYPSFKGIMAARKKPVRTLSLADLGLSAADVGPGAAWTVVDDVSARPARQAGNVVVDDGDAGRQLVAFLTEQGLV